MREILFRGKRKENGYWIDGGFCEYRNFSGEQVYNIIHNGYSNEVIPETVGQYTGLTDKNGTKIFEGDIVEDFIPFNMGLYDTNKYLVEYSDSLCGFKPFCESDHYGDTIIEQCKIIGNIHDNPELLKGK